MPDGSSRFLLDGKRILHYMRYMVCSIFSNFTVLSEIDVAKIHSDAPTIKCATSVEV